MAVPPRRSSRQAPTPNSATTSGPSSAPSPSGALVMDEVTRPGASVEIETMAKGMPKVKVRIDDESPDVALTTALRTYYATVENLIQVLPGILEKWGKEAGDGKS